MQRQMPQVRTSLMLYSLAIALYSVYVKKLLVVGGHLIVDISDQAHSHLGRVVSSQNIANKMCLDLHLYL